jgi:hypothetical protein
MRSIYAARNELAAMNMFEGPKAIDFGDWEWDL